MDELKSWAGLLATALSLVALVYSWITARSRTNSEELGRQGEKLTEHDRRIQSVEGELKHIPSKDDISDLRLAVSAMNGQLGRMEEGYSGVSRAVRRIEEYLLKEKG